MKAPPFQPGNSLGGRPRGARNKLSRKFLEDLMADWQDNGIAALKVMRRSDPVAYCRMICSIVPRELELTATAVAELSDDDLHVMIERLRAQITQERQVPLLTNGKIVDAEVLQ
jgi:hypothetical protein